jgi:alpha-D-ribose 1-methylphosphonate 5-triphosphate synthase subunit PhnH
MSVALPGFANPVPESQASFRAMLDAMAEPGRIVTIGAPLAAPAPLDPATAAVLLTLVDAETPLWLDPAVAGAAPWITFHCGAPAAAPAAALFAVALGLPDLMPFAAGTDEAPERGATVIVQLPALGSGRPWQLRGPGLAGAGTLHAAGLPDDFATLWAANASRYPRGIDLILCAGRALAALPRTAQVA